MQPIGSNEGKQSANRRPGNSQAGGSIGKFPKREEMKTSSRYFTRFYFRKCHFMVVIARDKSRYCGVWGTLGLGEMGGDELNFVHKLGRIVLGA